MTQSLKWQNNGLLWQSTASGLQYADDCCCDSSSSSLSFSSNTNTSSALISSSSSGGFSSSTSFGFSVSSSSSSEGFSVSSLSSLGLSSSSSSDSHIDTNSSSFSGSDCPTNCCQCQRTYSIHVPSGTAQTDCVNSGFGDSTKYIFSWNAQDIIITNDDEDGVDNCGWADLDVTFAYSKTLKAWYTFENCPDGETPNINTTTNHTSAVTLECLANKWRIRLDLPSDLQQVYVYYIKHASNCPDGTYTGGASVNNNGGEKVCDSSSSSSMGNSSSSSSSSSSGPPTCKEYSAFVWIAGSCAGGPPDATRIICMPSSWTPDLSCHNFSVIGGCVAGSPQYTSFMLMSTSQTGTCTCCP